LQQLHPLPQDLCIPLTQLTEDLALPLLHSYLELLTLLLRQQFSHFGPTLLLQGIIKHGLQLQDVLGAKGRPISPPFPWSGPSLLQAKQPPLAGNPTGRQITFHLGRRCTILGGPQCAWGFSGKHLEIHRPTSLIQQKTLEEEELTR
jgi:hypothetical protein